MRLIAGLSTTTRQRLRPLLAIGLVLAAGAAGVTGLTAGGCLSLS
jgi:hypothetical protein